MLVAVRVPTPILCPPVRMPDVAWVPTPPFTRVPVPVRVY